jgi:hypothetical protein
MGAKRNRRDLRKALEAGEPVRLHRSEERADTLDGFVVGVARDWALLHQLIDVRLDGWTAVRLDTVATVDRDAAPGALAIRVLNVRGQRPTAIAVDLTSAETVLRTMASALPLISLQREALHPGESVIGTPHRFSKKRIHLRDITTQATWDDVPYALKLADITRVDGGGDYDTALYQLAGDPPKIKSKRRSINAS